MRKRVFSILTICFMIMSMSLSAFAHGGRTDSSGGHKDNKNKSGLGSYHYHCGGYPAHLHTNGVCPYTGGGSSSYSSTPKTVYATSITAKNVPSKIDAGETATLEASVYPSNAEDKNITWESSDTSILVVSSTGSLTAVGVGTATITANADEKSAACVVQVKNIPVTSIVISKEKATIVIGETLPLTVVVSPDDATDKTVTWTTSEATVATVDKDGVVTAVAVGKATITAKAGEKSATCVVTVEYPAGVDEVVYSGEIMIYDLKGNRIADEKEAKQGVYIINGKKIMK